MKRPRSVSDDDQPKNPKLKKVQIPLRNSIEVAVVPRNHVVTTAYEHKKLQAKYAELEIRNAELETIIKKIETNQKQLDLDCKRLRRAIEENDKRIAKLENELEKNQEAIIIGKKILDLPNKRRCPATSEGLRLYSLMCSNLPGGSFKNFQQAIAIGVAAFFADNGLSNHFDSLDFIPYLMNNLFY